MQKYDRRSIMSDAWNIFRKGVQSFALALRMAWQNAKAQAEAKRTAGVTEETHTWYGWKVLGFEVIHESKALYKAILNDPSTKSGTRVTCYFGISQVQPVQA